MKDAVEKLLAQLPECSCDPEAFCRGAAYFSVSPAQVEAAAAALGENFPLRYRGVRTLLAVCVEEFAELFSGRREALCEVSVPAPPFAVLALQRERPDIRFVTGAFFAQIVLRSVLLSREPLDFSSCAKRHCGLNQMRIRLLQSPPFAPPEWQLQFGVLCGSCVKAGEFAPPSTRTFSVSFPEKAKSSRALAGAFYEELRRGFGVSFGCGVMKDAFGLFARMMRAENRITGLCTRPDREPLWGNALALAHSAQLLCTPRAERLVSALEELAEELEEAGPAWDRKRIYCYYVPFLQPEIERAFRERQVALVGEAAFLQTGRSVGLDLAGMTEAWLDNMINRAPPEKQCAAIAEAMTAHGCTSYLTGFFGFDRRLGATVPLQRRLLESRGMKTYVLDSDFWCENAMAGLPLQRIEHICL